MVDNRGVDMDPGWINRRFRDLQRMVEDVRNERRFASLPTTSATANMVVDATTGAVSRSTSSSRYKQDIDDPDLKLEDIWKMRPRTWRDRTDVARNPAGAPRYIGFVAEELHDAGLGIFVGYDAGGNPESVSYDRLTVALLVAVKFLRRRVQDLAAQGTSLQEALTAAQEQVSGLRADVHAAATEYAAQTAQTEARLAALEAAAEPTTTPEPTGE